MEPMKATGIVRRIDELGRVVIPKEIRRTQRIRRGDPLEIFTTGDGEVIFKKYSPIGELQGVAMQYAEVLSKSFALTAFVADRDRMMAVAGAGRRDLADRSISQPLEKLMESRKPYLRQDAEQTVLPCEGSPSRPYSATIACKTRCLRASIVIAPASIRCFCFFSTPSS
jgi:AbrB family transcriptional regulator, stage V sporulation protein T